MLWIIIILIIIILYLLFLLFSIKKGIRSVSEQLKEIGNEKIDKNISVSLLNFELSNLATEINHNIDIQRKLNSNMYRQEKQLKDSIAYISHDLRTPLTSIMGYLQLLKKDGLNEEQEYNLNIALKKSETLKELIDSFFELSRLESKSSIDLKRINVSNIISNSILENIDNFNKINIRPEISISEEPAFILGDPLMIKRIIENLISNAIKYSSGNIWIELNQRECVELVVRNSIDESIDIDLDNIFEKFHTGDKARTYKGTGLGLPIVKILVEKMNGDISRQIINNNLEIAIRFKNIQEGKVE